MNTSKISTLLAIAASTVFSACAVSKTPTPSLQGPSTLGTSLTITANPDVLSMDGASQSLIVIDVRDANGQPKPNVQLRTEISANGQLVDFGSLSARTAVTNANGRATVTYTAPTGSQGQIPTLDIYVTPGGTDQNSGFPSAQYISIRLVPPGTISAGGPTPAFTFTPATPTAFTDVQFDASTSVAAVGSAIVTYSWNFGDNTSGLGVTASHRFAAGTWSVTLTTTDSNGVSSSIAKQVPVGVGAIPSADFSFSPTLPTTNQDANFNGGLSKAGAGHTIVRYDWNFGSGNPQSGITVTKMYDTPGTYNVTLTVTDEVGQQAIATKPVTVSSAAVTTAEFSSSPTSPKALVDAVYFDGTPSKPQAGASITQYSWNFGDGATAVTAVPTTQHTYASSNSYTARLTITDSKGGTATVTHAISVVP